jgi:glutamyl-Q tRNA(Asp) synthetase
MFVTRFAPSPTGLLHLGHAFSALRAFDAAQAARGRLILRIEDTDAGRCRPEFEAAIYEDLAWLGVEWVSGVRRQCEHMNEYEAVLGRLIGLGVMYRCFKTRKELLADIAHAPHSQVEAYRGGPLSADQEASKIANGEAFAWRLSLDKSKDYLGEKWSSLGCMIDGEWTLINPARPGDAVLARKEFATSYHLASVWDDAQAGITDVIRGVDLIDAPHLHVLLQALLGLATPQYHHHRLILDDTGKRLAKRDQSVTLRAMRDAGLTPADIRARLGLGQ